MNSAVRSCLIEAIHEAHKTCRSGPITDEEIEEEGDYACTGMGRAAKTQLNAVWAAAIGPSALGHDHQKQYRDRELSRVRVQEPAAMCSA
jgi:hypothetical protein